MTLNGQNVTIAEIKKKIYGAHTISGNNVGRWFCFLEI